MSSSDRERIDQIARRATLAMSRETPREEPMFPQIAADEAAGRNYRGLKEAVEKLYRAAYWTPDRKCDAEGLWEDVRDKAGLEIGKSPRNYDPAIDKVVSWVRAAMEGTTCANPIIVGEDTLENGDKVFTIRVCKMENFKQTLEDCVNGK